MPEAKMSYLIVHTYCTCLIKQANELLTMYGFTTIVFCLLDDCLLVSLPRKRDNGLLWRLYGFNFIQSITPEVHSVHWSLHFCILILQIYFRDTYIIHEFIVNHRQIAANPIIEMNKDLELSFSNSYTTQVVHVSILTIEFFSRKVEFRF